MGIISFYQLIYDVLHGTYFSNGGTILELFYSVLAFIRPFSILLSLLFLTGIIYCMLRINEVMRVYVHGQGGGHGSAHGHASGHASAPHSGHQAKPPHASAPQSTSNIRWEKIVHNINSTNPSDWRLAILECDIILDEMLTKMSYHGETLSEKLKAVERSDFLSIDRAWEAHLVRNAIAHQGSDFKITDREAKRVVGLYESVFKEFHYI